MAATWTPECDCGEGFAARAHGSIICPTSASEGVLSWIDFRIDATMRCGKNSTGATCRFSS